MADWAAGLFADTGANQNAPVPARPASAAERQMRASVQLSPAEQARNDAYEHSPSNLAELRSTIANEKDPAKLKILNDALAQIQGTAAPTSPSAPANDWAAGLFSPTPATTLTSQTVPVSAKSATPVTDWRARVKTEFNAAKDKVKGWMSSLNGASIGIPTVEARPNGPQPGDTTIPQLAVGAGENLLHGAVSTAGSAVGGLAGLAGAALPGPAGQGADWASKVSDFLSSWSKPHTEAGKAIESGIGKVGETIGQGAGAVGSSLGRIAGNEAAGETIGEITPAVVGTLMGGKALLKKPNAEIGARTPGGETPVVGTGPAGTVTAKDALQAQAVNKGIMAPQTATAARAAAEARGETVPFDAPELPKTGASTATQTARADVLRRIGMDQADSAAIAGKGFDRGVTYQLSKFQEPAGQAAAEMLAKERAALETHAENTIKSTGGTVGLDQSAIGNRGQVISDAIDAGRASIQAQKQALYEEAERRSGGMPMVSVEPIESLLNDRTFKNSAWAQDNKNFLNAAENQLNLFKENNPGGLTVANVEQFNQWLNANWTKDNKGIISQLRDAADTAVTKSAGEDVYAAARQLHQLEKATYDNPKGMNRLFESDPQAPMNRVTPYEKVPETLTRLPPAQFRQVLDTLRNAPEAVQPQSQAALAEIRAQYANKLAEAGGDNKGAWNAKKVSDYRKANSANIAEAFKDDPASLAKIDDLESAGHILSYSTAYPGAAAQASNAIKQGAMSHAIHTVATMGGSAIGSAIGGPFGQFAGHLTGSTLGGKATASMAEKAALAKVNKRMVPLNQITKNPTGNP